MKKYLWDTEMMFYPYVLESTEKYTGIQLAILIADPYPVYICFRSFLLCVFLPKQQSLTNFMPQMVAVTQHWNKERKDLSPFEL